MNSTFNTALKQTSSIRRDLDSFASLPPESSHIAVQGQISTTLTSLSRTLETYQSQAKSEPSSEKQSKALERLKNFRTDLTSFQETFQRLKTERQEISHTQARNELLGRRGYHAGGGTGDGDATGERTQTPENPYARAQQSSNPLFTTRDPSGGGSGNGGLGFGAGHEYRSREDHALREQSFLSQTSNTLDEYLERGRAVLGDLGQQRDVLKGTQKRLYSVGTTLGISGDTIRMVERRAKQDKWIFYGGVLVFCLFCWLVIHYLR